MLDVSEEWLCTIRRLIKPGSETSAEIKNKKAMILEGSFSDNGLYHAGNNAACNDYIYNSPKYWIPDNYISAILLRFNMLPCMGMPGRPFELRKYKAGCAKQETESLILQNCPITHCPRIQRHNWVRSRLAKTARNRKYLVHNEPHIRDIRGEVKNTDMILITDNKYIITDVTIS